MNSFCLRQFEHGDIGLTAAEFAAAVNARVEAGAEPRDGYAPFCKHLLLDNFTTRPAQCVAITADNAEKLRSDYAARESHELPVLRRFFPASELPPRPPAARLDVILYSREQVEREEASRPDAPAPAERDYDWAIISFKAQEEDCELPMLPITMMRNSLGKAEGGSGVELDRAKYLAAVEYWSHHALVM